MKNKLTNLNTRETNSIKKKAEKGFKQLLKYKAFLTKGIVPISNEEIQNLTLVEDIQKAPHELILKCIRVYVDAVCNDEIIVKDYEKEAFGLGYLYAYCVEQATQMNWRLCFLESEYLSEVAVVDKNQKFAMYPQMYIYRLFKKQKTDNVLLLTYNMVKETDSELVKNTPDNSLSIILG